METVRVVPPGRSLGGMGKGYNSNELHKVWFYLYEVLLEFA